MAATEAIQPSAYGRDGERLGAMAKAAKAVAAAAVLACRALTDTATKWRQANRPNEAAPAGWDDGDERDDGDVDDVPTVHAEDGIDADHEHSHGSQWRDGARIAAPAPRAQSRGSRTQTSDSGGSAAGVGATAAMPPLMRVVVVGSRRPETMDTGPIPGSKLVYILRSTGLGNPFELPQDNSRTDRQWRQIVVEAHTAWLRARSLPATDIQAGAAGQSPGILRADGTAFPPQILTRQRSLAKATGVMALRELEKEIANAKGKEVLRLSCSPGCVNGLLCHGDNLAAEAVSLIRAQALAAGTANRDRQRAQRSDKGSKRGPRAKAGTTGDRISYLSRMRFLHGVERQVSAATVAAMQRMREKRAAERPLIGTARGLAAFFNERAPGHHTITTKIPLRNGETSCECLAPRQSSRLSSIRSILCGFCSRVAPFPDPTATTYSVLAAPGRPAAQCRRSTCIPPVP